MIGRDGNRPMTLWKGLWLAWLIAVLPRLAFVAAFGYHPDTLLAPDHEYWYPLYRGLAPLLFMASGKRPAIDLGIHIVLAAMIGPVVYLLARRLGLPPAARWLAVVAVALLPYYVSMAGNQPQAGLTVPAFAAVLLLFTDWIWNGFPIGQGILVALSSVLLVTLRPNATVTLACLFAVACVVGVRADRASVGAGGRRVALSRVVACLIATGVFLAAWSWINQRSTGRFSPFPNIGGYNLFVGNNPHVGDYAGRYDFDSLEDFLLRQNLMEAPTADDRGRIEVDRRLAREALDYIADHPLQTLKNAGFKSLRYWDFRLEKADRNPFLWNLAYTLPYVCLVVLSLVGIRAMWRARLFLPLAILLGVILSYWLPHAIYYGTIRMRMTTEFALILLAAFAFAGADPALSPARRFPSR